jgi:hypothetical protein
MGHEAHSASDVGQGRGAAPEPENELRDGDRGTTGDATGESVTDGASEGETDGGRETARDGAGSGGSVGAG